ncbi:MAG: hypothetical protein ACYC7D_04675 [Nitrososphaerales archaeon]
MVDFATTIVGITGATLIPVYISLYLITNLRFIHTRYIAAFGVGLAFFFFFDTMNDAAQLDVNSSFSGGLPQLGLIIAFVLGIATLSIFDYVAVPNSKKVETGRDVSKNNGGTTSRALFLIPAAVAAVMGIHGLSEGWAFGAAASNTGTVSFTNAFGGLSALASYPMHKFLEAGIVAVVYVAYVGRSRVSAAKWQIPVLGLLFGLLPVIGAFIGYTINIDTTYFYAFGVTAAIYAIIRLVEPMSLKFKVGENAPAYLGPKVFLALLIGFLLLYSAALFH